MNLSNSFIVLQGLVTSEQWANFTFIENDIHNQADCVNACEGVVDFVLHQAALGSVPRSINDPITTNAANITGFLNMLLAARDAGVESFTYAAGSSTYGDHPALPRRCLGILITKADITRQSPLFVFINGSTT
ncbi:hypothetical protein GCM10011533_07910 [Streptosporangium jomthongense]|nr:hypothetical protein GCM10011533_07910 [Streptosporangium jomthongense]